ncbi:hypothetical protein CCASP_05460 [Corynebacterium caspium DSM 44850]|nr:hypothetical protein CCASP_05460 [Corynebacterium caspium DSM 44850]
MPEPIIRNEGLLTLEENLIKHAPSQSGIEYQNDLPGYVIELPAGTAHQSTAGSNGCSYLILPEGGKAAITSAYPIGNLC